MAITLLKRACMFTNYRRTNYRQIIERIMQGFEVVAECMRTWRIYTSVVAHCFRGIYSLVSERRAIGAHLTYIYVRGRWLFYGNSATVPGMRAHAVYIHRWSSTKNAVSGKGLKIDLLGMAAAWFLTSLKFPTPWTLMATWSPLILKKLLIH